MREKSSIKIALTHGQARSEKTVTEIFLEVLIARVFVGLLKSRRAAAALARGIIFCFYFRRSTHKRGVVG
jgi:hypothetical protein